jgi:hypothetical protein
MHVSKILGMVMVTVAAGLSSSSASAVTTSYAGSNCKQEISTTQKVVYQSGRVFAQQTSRSYLVCPAAQQGGALTGAQVTGRDLNFDDSVTCYASSHNEWDTAGINTPSVSSGPGTNYTLILASLPSYFAKGSKNIHCIMPANVGIDGSSIGAYVVDEL